MLREMRRYSSTPAVRNPRRRFWWLLPLCLLLIQALVIYYIMWGSDGNTKPQTDTQKVYPPIEDIPEDTPHPLPMHGKIMPFGTKLPGVDEPRDFHDLEYDYELKNTNRPDHAAADDHWGGGNHRHGELRKLMELRKKQNIISWQKRQKSIIGQARVIFNQHENAVIKVKQENKPYKALKKTLKLPTTRRRLLDFRPNLPLFKEYSVKQKRRKKILLWTTFWGRDDYFFGFGHKPFQHHGCLETACELTNDRRQLESSDAVLFHINNLNSSRELPTKRPISQHWVVFNMEPPQYTRLKLKEFDNVFNLTATYRWDSDVPSPYGFSYRERRTRHIKQNPASFKQFKDKTKTVVWFASNCNTQSKRENYVQQLEKHIKIDVYGRCGPLKCKKWSESCNKLIEDYKFYLAFENSFCQDYITEKAFRALIHGTIPVVMGKANYERILPPNAYIDVRDFKTPKHLAEHLEKVGRDSTLYAEYQAWRETHHVAYPYYHMFCSLCTQLHQRGNVRATERRLNHWYNGTNVCISAESYYRNMHDVL